MLLIAGTWIGVGIVLYLLSGWALGKGWIPYESRDMVAVFSMLWPVSVLIGPLILIGIGINRLHEKIKSMAQETRK